MSAMATAPPSPAPRLDSVLSFSDAPASPAPAEAAATLAFSDAGSGSDTDAEDDADFEFAFAPPLSPRAGAYPALAPADDLFAHGRIIAAYPLFDRHLVNDEASSSLSPPSDLHQQASTAPPSPDTYCAWAPRSAPGSPSRDYPPPAAAAAAFPKSSSTGEARRFWRLRDLVSGGGGRSHSDGKEKFVFLQPSSSPATKAAAAPLQKQGKKKTKGSTGNGKAAGATEMDMATAHRLFYGKPAAAGAAALASDRTKQQQQSYLPYRPSIVGFFTTAHALGRSHHPY
ncbi:uncharacterized protein LOC8057525 [Sorghum bicolor]|uniref:Uncharacterized protein n=1 Tax=Sorghum bicolor TaxID=4558 RepID=A0A194YMJ8_SORBI|nr:uncharacterized protein LOC8057525 [Sorghum bicolor]KXG29411.1 hypothetical protein SORBI_3004G032300 [Sorghum bicolor]|eukprot:XP_002453267.2 uncharacterized protein LOC8057525 [Sorghum bicolor]